MNATRSSASGVTKRATGASGSWQRWWAIGFGAGLAVLALCWWLWPADYSNDPRVVELRKLQEEAQQRLTATGGGPSNMTEAREFVASMERIRQKTGNLPPQLQRAVMRGGANFFFSSMRQRIDDYYAAPPGTRQKLLDQQIRQSDLMRKAFEEARTAQAAPKSTAGPGRQDSSGRPGQGGQNAESGRSRWSNRSQDERNEWFRDRILNRTSPEQRAKYVEYRRAASARREQLGLPAGWP